MKSTILLLAVTLAALSSCTTSYKTGQTPDDVYFSPARPQSGDEEVFSEQREDNVLTDNYYDDRYLRMKVRNRMRWNSLDDWYTYDRYSLGYNYYYGSYHNPYNSWNYYYNPYCCCHTNNIYSNPKTSTVYTKPRMFNLGSYNVNNTNNGNTYTNPKYGGQGTTNNGTYTAPRNNSNSTRSNNSGNILRNIFNNSSSSSSSGSNNNSNTSSSSNSNSSSSSSGSSSSAPVRRF